MNKSELVERLWEANPHLTRHDTEIAVAAIFDVITAALVRGGRVELRGFGTFAVKKHDARMGRDPRTGKRVAVSEKHFPYFRTSTSAGFYGLDLAPVFRCSQMLAHPWSQLVSNRN